MGRGETRWRLTDTAVTALILAAFALLVAAFVVKCGPPDGKPQAFPPCSKLAGTAPGYATGYFVKWRVMRDNVSDTRLRRNIRCARAISTPRLLREQAHIESWPTRFHPRRTELTPVRSVEAPGVVMFWFDLASPDVDKQRFVVSLRKSRAGWRVNGFYRFPDPPKVAGGSTSDVSRSK